MIIRAKNIIPKKTLRHPITREEVEEMVYKMIPVGIVKGRIGGWRVRWQNGIPIIYKKADVYNASQSLASINNRSNMGAAFQLAAALNKGLLKEIWNSAAVEGLNSYTRLIKHFRKTLKGNIPSADIRITPPEFHFIIDESVNFDSNKTIKINNKLNSETSLIVVLVPFNSVKSGLKNFEVISFCVSDDSEIHLSTEQSCICSNYSNYILYSVLIKHNEQGFLWSNTIYAEGEFAVQRRSSNKSDTSSYTLIRLNEIKPLKTDIRTKKKKAHPPPGRIAVLGNMIGITFRMIQR